MIVMQRWLVSISALAFGLYHAFLGLIMLLEDKDKQPRLVIVALVIYVLVLIMSITMYERMKLPWYQAWADLAAVITVPLLMQLQLSQDQKGGYATWYVAASATVLAVMAVRQHRVLAWLGLVALCFEVLYWGGVGFFLNSGLIGAISFVVAGTLLSIGLEGTTKATLAFTEEAKTTAARSARTSASRLERQTRTQEALRGALPMLRAIVARNGQLHRGEKDEAVLLEAALRDEIAGGRFIDALVRDAVREARRRGVEVSMRDEGGLEGCELTELEKIRFKVVEVLNRASTGRAVIRAPRGERWRVTLVVTQPGKDEPDEFIRL